MDKQSGPKRNTCAWRAWGRRKDQKKPTPPELCAAAAIGYGLPAKWADDGTIRPEYAARKIRQYPRTINHQQTWRFSGLQTKTTQILLWGTGADQLPNIPVCFLYCMTVPFDWGTEGGEGACQRCRQGAKGAWFVNSWQLWYNFKGYVHSGNKKGSVRRISHVDDGISRETISRDIA